MKQGQESLWQRAAGGVLLIYKGVFSPLLHAVGMSGGACRFQPTCSEYAALAWHVHGPLQGTRLAGWRLLRCHPFARGGFDPVPDVRDGRRGKSSNPPAAI